MESLREREARVKVFGSGGEGEVDDMVRGYGREMREGRVWDKNKYYFFVGVEDIGMFSQR